MSAPPSPPHPLPNEEIDHLPEGQLPGATIDDLELNPDLYNDVSDDELDDVNANGASEVPNGDDSSKSKSNKNVENENDNDQTEKEVEAPSFTLAFDSALELTESDFSSNSTNATGLTLSQQSRFINYIDERLLAIQRKFIKSHIEGEVAYPMMELLKDLSKTLDLIWYSINSKSKLFGQQHYFIKIMGDLEDYISKLNIGQSLSAQNYELSNEDEADLMELFFMLQNLDVRLSFLFDGFKEESGNTIQKLSGTEAVRLGPIVSRLRVIVVDKLESLRSKLAQSSSNSSRHISNILDVETGKLFEGLSQRI
ncbi:uncharacterized protein CLIB1423_06S03950 [[Candida] railenensis]|uniref:Uncharacterized protein n=1 Tax=[Candida] railenensis TaxID=45579 RepID=A0A9P0VXT5_9ASCO|nr:uncharacterized protein CLIB1423_06S03950 [[Candida] railenensis]